MAEESGFIRVNDRGLIPSSVIRQNGLDVDPKFTSKPKIQIDYEFERFAAASAEVKAIKNRAEHEGNEELIATEIARIIHKYYGVYHPETSENVSKVRSLTDNIDYLEGKESGLDKYFKNTVDEKVSKSSKEEVLAEYKKLKEEAREKFSKAYEARGGVLLSSHGDDSLVCLEQALLASHFLDDCGIDNHFAFGYVTFGEDGRIQENTGHVFVVINKSGAILDPTSNDPLDSYKTTKSSDDPIKSFKAGEVLVYTSRGNPNFKVVYSVDPTKDSNDEKLIAEKHNTAAKAAKPEVRGEIPDILVLKKFEQLYADFIDEDDRSVEFEDLRKYAKNNYDKLEGYFKKENSRYIDEFSFPPRHDQNKKLLADRFVSILQERAGLSGLESYAKFSERVERFEKETGFKVPVGVESLESLVKRLPAEEKEAFEKARASISWMSGDDEVKAFGDLCSELDAKIKAKDEFYSEFLRLMPNFIDGNPDNDKDSVVSVAKAWKKIGIDLPDVEMEGAFVGTQDASDFAMTTLKYLMSKYDADKTNDVDPKELVKSFETLAKGRDKDFGNGGALIGVLTSLRSLGVVPPEEKGASHANGLLGASMRMIEAAQNDSGLPASSVQGKEAKAEESKTPNK